ncbi:MAG TPA: hypothetical protein VFL13_01875 [Candidatus Baltobacteraceae bacterium]|nr:hypothetical protein [Candidatus Baltobacteraceae bacterium]
MPGKLCALLALAVFGIAIAPLNASSDTAGDAAGIHVVSCQVVSGLLVPRANEIGLAVRFQNTGFNDLSTIVWRAKYGTGWIDFTGDGTYSPSTIIDNYLVYESGTAHFNWASAALAVVTRDPFAYTGPVTPVQFAPYAGTSDPSNCQIVRTVTKDGSVWNNSALADEHVHLPPPAPVRTRSGPLTFTHCRVNTKGGPHLEVTFYNDETHKTADRITIRASLEEGAVDFTDAGTFAPSIPIEHKLRGEYSSPLPLYVSFDDPSLCRAEVVHYTDGSEWSDPQLGPPSPPPSPVPNAIDLSRARLVTWAHSHPEPTPQASASPLSANTQPEKQAP